MNDKSPKTIIVIPAYNEASALPKVLDDLLRHFSPENILVIDDGSTDETSLAVKEKKIKIIQHFLNRGAGAATKTGLVYAFDELRANLVVTFDADGQHDHNDILNLINPIIKGEADVVLGSRFLNEAPRGNLRGIKRNPPKPPALPSPPAGGFGEFSAPLSSQLTEKHSATEDKQNLPLFRRAANYCANFFTWLLFGVWVSDSQSGFKALSREAWQKIEIHGDHFEFCSEIIAEIKRNKLRYTEIPIKVYYSQYSQSKGQNLANGLKTLARLIINQFSE